MSTKHYKLCQQNATNYVNAIKLNNLVKVCERPRAATYRRDRLRIMRFRTVISKKTKELAENGEFFVFYVFTKNGVLKKIYKNIFYRLAPFTVL